MGLAVPTQQAKRIAEIWRGLHVGDGHGETDSRTAARARRRHEAERDYYKQLAGHWKAAYELEQIVRNTFEKAYVDRLVMVPSVTMPREMDE